MNAFVLKFVDLDYIFYKRGIHNLLANVVLRRASLVEHGFTLRARGALHCQNVPFFRPAHLGKGMRPQSGR